MRKKVAIIGLTSFCLLYFTTTALAKINLGFISLKKPSSQNELHPLTTQDQDSAVSREKAFVKVFGLAAHFQEGTVQNFFSMRFVVGPSKLMLYNGEVVRLAGLMSANELDLFQEKNPFYLKRVQRLSTVNMDFLRSYLKDKKLKIKYDQELGVDADGDPYAYVYLDNGEFINAGLLEAGHGVVSEEGYFEDYSTFKGYEAEARLNRRGIWR